MAEGDVNCDGLTSAADLAMLSALVPHGDSGPCAGGDVNGDGVVDERDLTALVGSIFGSPAQ